MKLFIGNLSYDTSELELKELLEPYEPILEFARPIDHETGRPRGFAFVTLVDADKGQEAIDALNGKEFAGRQLRVNEAEDRGRPPSRRHHGGSDGIGEGSKERIDDRPSDKNGNKVVYKSI